MVHQNNILIFRKYFQVLVNCPRCNATFFSEEFPFVANVRTSHDNKLTCRLSEYLTYNIGKVPEFLRQTYMREHTFAYEGPVAWFMEWGMAAGQKANRKISISADIPLPRQWYYNIMQGYELIQLMKGKDILLVTGTAYLQFIPFIENLPKILLMSSVSRSARNGVPLNGAWCYQ